MATTRTRNRMVRIKKYGQAQDNFGQPVPIEETHATVWANIRHLSGVETIKAGAEVAVGSVSIRVNYRRDITTAMRVVDGATEYQIKAVLPDEERRQHVDLVCAVVN
jgi:SPP1 family predicted phage head-tail adaptor